LSFDPDFPDFPDYPDIPRPWYDEEEEED